MIGRDPEVRAVSEFLDGVRQGIRGLLLEGEVGVGKTAIWMEAVAGARDRGYAVLVSRPAEAEAKLSFAGLTDLLGGVVDDVFPQLPVPQREALEVAMVLAPSEGPSPNPLAISLAVHGVLRTLAERGAVLVAVDDLQWLDSPSALALEFAIRRLAGEPVGFLAAIRQPVIEEPPLRLDRALSEDRLRKIPVGPLGVEDLDRILRARIGATLSRADLSTLHRVAGGNPFYALEIGRALLRQGLPTKAGRPLPIPGDLRQLVQDRLADLPDAVRQTLLVVSALSEPTVALIERAAGPDARDALAAEIQGGVLEVEEGRVRFTHSLLGSVLYSDTPPDEVLRLHRRLGDVVDEPEERARHLALGAEGPDEEVAAALEEAARVSRARGAPATAAELCEQAMRLTPPDRAEDARRRSVRAAEYHLDAGDPGRSRGLLEDLVASLPHGAARAEALQRLGWARYHVDSWSVAAELFDEALKDAATEPRLAVSLALDRSLACLLSGDLPSAARYARSALERATGLDNRPLVGEALAMVGSVDFLLGEGMPGELMERAVLMESWSYPRPTAVHPTVAFGLMLKWADDLDGARDRLEAAYDRLVQDGNERSQPFLLYHLAELECWAGNWDTAAGHAQAGSEIASRTGQDGSRAFNLYARSLIAALRGEADTARSAAEDGLALAERSGAVPAKVLLVSVLGFIELSAGEPARAHRHLGPLVDSVLAVGVHEPGAMRYMGDAMETLVALGDLERVETILPPFEARAQELDRVWGLAVAARSRGLVLAAHGDPAGALAALDQALVHHERLRQPFELARTLLVRGTVQRRDRQKRSARESLEAALDVFQGLGAPLWAERTQAELGRIGGRAPAPLALTPTEQRVAELTAQGRSNREVAEALFMSPKTVEWNLTRIYRKLGVRSRTELSRSLAARDRHLL